MFWEPGHLFNVVAGLFAGVFVFGSAVLHTIGTSIVVYLLMMVTPRYRSRLLDAHMSVDMIVRTSCFVWQQGHCGPPCAFTLVGVSRWNVRVSAMSLLDVCLVV